MGAHFKGATALRQGWGAHLKGKAVGDVTAVLLPVHRPCQVPGSPGLVSVHVKNCILEATRGPHNGDCTVAHGNHLQQAARAGDVLPALPKPYLVWGTDI